MANSDQAPPAHGDEAELFRLFNPRLMRYVSGVVKITASDTLEEACAHAWAQFMQHQPDRGDNWRAWLSVVAERHAWAIERKLQREIPNGSELALSTWAKNTAAENPIELFDDLNDALSVVAPLSPRLRQVALLRAFGLGRDDIAEITGDSGTRVDHLLRRANLLIGETLMERAHAERPSSPRAERLWQLERHPPGWLVERIGEPSRTRKREGHGVARREWRRAAMALDDYRTAAGAETFDAMRCGSRADSALRGLHAAAMRSVAALERLRDRGVER
jgi:DNA-directed RNA polymerase specialized sigma24 family protein